ncbi:hypothetical protein [uncultured Methylobacterium sp.]
MFSQFHEGFAGTADPTPPPIIEPWRVAALFLSVSSIIWFVHSVVHS